MTDATGDSNSLALGWLKDELNETLKQAIQSLEFFVENTSDEGELEACAESMQQISGTLSMVAAEGPMLLTAQVQVVLGGLASGTVERSNASFEILMRGMLELPVYLEYLQSGGRDLPAALLPIVNELRALTHEAPLPASDFFNPRLDVFPPDSTTEPVVALQQLAGKIRPIFQKALVALYRQPNDPAPVRMLTRSTDLLLQASSDSVVRRLWWVVGGLVEALGSGLVADKPIILLLGRIDRELKRLAATDEGNFAARQDDRLLAKLLYVIAHAPAEGERVRELREAFELDVSAPGHDDIEDLVRQLHGPDAMAMRSVATGIKDDFSSARDIIEIYGAASDGSTEDLAPLGDLLEKMAATLSMVGLGELGAAVGEQAAVVRNILSGDVAADEENVVEVAKALLHVEAYIKELIDGTGVAMSIGEVPASQEADSGTSTAQSQMSGLEYRQVMRVVYDSALQDIGAARDAIIAVTGDKQDASGLAEVPLRLQSVVGALEMAGQQRLADVTGHLAEMIGQLIDQTMQLDALSTDLLADVITAVESCLEANRQDHSGLHFLDIAESRIAELAQVAGTSPQIMGADEELDLDLDLYPVTSGDELTVALDVSGMDFDSMPGELSGEHAPDETAFETLDLSDLRAEEFDLSDQADMALLDDADDTGLSAEAEDEIELAPVAAVAEAGVDELPAAALQEILPDIPVLSESYDAETLDIFLEEADEEVAALNGRMAAWHADPSDAAALGDIRRSFHTLKGSGRLVGALLIGEFAWSFEDLLNHITEGPLETTPEIQELVGRAIAVLPVMVEQLRGGHASVAELASLMAGAGALAEGRPLPRAVAQVVEVAEELSPDSEPLPESTAGEPDLSEPAASLTDYQILSDDYDAETLDIFLEEADEVIEAMVQAMATWRDAPGDRDLLGEIRRAFHTLKGSGRLVGAILVGEFSWSFEALLNKVLEDGLETTPDLQELIGQAIDILPDLVAQLRGSNAAVGRVGTLMAAAEALANGTPMPSIEVPEDLPAEEESSTGPRMEAVLYGIYAQEADEYLTTIRLSGDALRDGNLTNEVTDGMQRALHTLRGSSSVEAVTPIAELAHGLESLWGSLISGADDLAATLPDLIADTTDAMEQYIAALGNTDLPLPDLSSLSDRIAELNQLTVENTAKLLITAEESGNLLTAGADLVDELDDSINLWAAASADPTPLHALADEVEKLSGVLSEIDSGQLIPLAMLNERLGTLVGSIISGNHGASGEILTVLNDSADTLTSLFDAIAVSRNINQDDDLIARLDALSARQPVTDSVDSIEAADDTVPLIEVDEESSAEEPEAQESIELVDLTAADAESIPAVEEATDTADEPVEATVTIDTDLIDPATLDPDLLEIFFEEAGEILDAAETAVHLWREDPADRKTLAQLQRQLHTLKGGSRMAGLTTMGDLSHAAESILTAVVNGQLGTDEALFAALEESVDQLVGMLEAVRSGSPIAPARELLEDFSDLLQGSSTQSDDAVTPVAESAPATAPVEDVAGDVVDTSALDPDLLDIFLEETTELLDAAESAIHEWQGNRSNHAPIAQLQRQLHTVKGGSRMVGIAPMGDLSHASESLLTSVVEGRLEPTETLFTVLNRAVDRLATMLDAVRRRKGVSKASDLESMLAELAAGREPDLGLALPVAPVPERMGADLEPAKPAEVAVRKVEQAKGKSSQEVVRVKAELLNNLVNLSGEVGIYRSRIEQQNTVLRNNLGEFDQTVVRLRAQLRKLEIETDGQILSRLEAEGRSVDDFDPLEMDRYTELQTLSRSLLESLDDLNNLRELYDSLTRESDTMLLQQSRVTTELQQGLMQARMMPFSRMVPRMRRLVRQTSQELGKQVELWVQGEASEVDSAIIDRIVAPLEHLIRNAIAHGIEPPDARRAAGKPKVGKLTISVDREGADIVFRVKDDGAGIDVEKVRNKAVERGLLAADAQVSDHDVMQYIFESGMSTAEKVSQVSGRGVGMDVVIIETKQLGGRVDINSERGHGTSFYIRLPFTLAITQALLVETGEDLFAIPLTAIEGIVRLDAATLQAHYDDPLKPFEQGGEQYLVRHLGALLGIGAPRHTEGVKVPVLLVRSGEQGLALPVDGLIGSREIVVKSVGPQLSKVKALFGATILVDGRVALILDTGALSRMSAQAVPLLAETETVAPGAGSTAQTIMIVDDSITVRRVTERLLKRRGYEVVMAKDGIDALQVLQETVPDVMLLDIEMPRMDGFELAQHIRNDDQLHDLPIIMITSRTGEKHQQRGLAIGVNRFLGKPYQDAELIESIQELSGRSTHGDGNE